jgi:CheY-like chemotaxis protein
MPSSAVCTLTFVVPRISLPDAIRREPMHDSEDRKRVLVVDDERVIANTLVTIFSNAGYEAKAVYSAEEALQLLGGGWVPHHAIVDVSLPGMNGVDLAIRVKAEYPGCRLTLFSGHGASGALTTAAQEDGHFFALLAKPIHPTELLALLASDLPNA